MFAFVGCYTTADRRGRGKGINVFRMDPSSGGWTHAFLLDGIPNPSYLTLDPRERCLYAVHGGGFQDVSAFAVHPTTGQLRFLNKQSTLGENPVSLCVDVSGQFVAVANYGAGSVAVLPITSDGSLGPPADSVRQTGELGPHSVEQTSSHPHDILFDPAGRFLAVPDKGLDRVFVYGLDRSRARLVPSVPPSVQARPGAAPRHVAFHPSQAYAYVINELDSTVTTYQYDADRGALRPLQVLSTLPPDFHGKNTGAEIAVAPSGGFVYASNRGHDSIAVFAVAPEAGTLAPVSWTPTGGATPRTFALDPSGSFLYAANQDSHTVVAFAVDGTTGRLAPTGQVIETGSPVCIVFASLAGAGR